MILTGPEIQAALGRGELSISDFDEKRLNEMSYDVRLGNKVAVYKRTVWDRAHDDAPAHERLGRFSVANGWLDAAQDNELIELELKSGEPICIKPGIGYLMHTAEVICTSKYVPIIDGKSSVGRLFVSIHQTAGFGEPGWDGQWTLEVTCLHPVRLYVGMRIGQVRFEVPQGEVRQYTGNYQDLEGRRGPVGSRTHRQIAADVREGLLTLAPTSA